MGSNEYIRHYECNLKVLTWGRDSYGLYDYEARNPSKTPFKFDGPRAIVRVGLNSFMERMDVDVDEKYKKTA